VALFGGFLEVGGKGRRGGLGWRVGRVNAWARGGVLKVTWVRNFWGGSIMGFGHMV